MKLRQLTFGTSIALGALLASGPSAQADWEPAISDVMSMVYCVVGLDGCEGLQPGADTVTQVTCGDGTVLNTAETHCVLTGDEETTFESTDANAEWSMVISDVMNLVYCLVGLGECVGLEPGLDTVVFIACAEGTSLDDAETSCVAEPDLCGVPGGDGSLCSCAYLCGEASADGSCYCDSLCGLNGDCCGDFDDQCAIGCMQEGYCNYDPDATLEDDYVDCWYPDDNGFCDGECDGIVDECGVCGGNGYAQGACDCDGNVIDCDGVCGGTATEDVCGLCGGNGSACSCADHCGGYVHSEEVFTDVLGGGAFCECDADCEEAGTCCWDFETTCTLGCTDGAACDYDEAADVDDGSCTYADENTHCDGTCAVETDCDGVCGGTATEDTCGICDGDGSACSCAYLCGEASADGSCYCDSLCGLNGDCCGDFDDQCAIGCMQEGYCNYDPDATLEDDYVDCWYPDDNGFCDGECDGIVDECGVCGGNGYAQGACDCDGSVIDCDGVCGGDAAEDVCGVCEGDGSTCLDCPDSSETAGACTDCPDGYAGSVTWDADQGIWDESACAPYDCPNPDEGSGSCTQCPEGMQGSLGPWSDTLKAWDQSGCTSPCAFGESIAIDGLTHDWQQVAFSGVYADPVVFVAPPTQNGADTSVIRLRNIDAEGFEVRIQETLCASDGGTHAYGESSFAWVFESGTFVLEDGSLLEVGQVLTDALVYDDAWEEVTLSAAFSDPAVFASVQTFAGGAVVTPRVQSVSSTSFLLTMQESPAEADGYHAFETVGYLVMEQGVHEGGASGTTWEAGTLWADDSGASVTASFEGAVGAYTAAMMSFEDSEFAVPRVGANDGSGFSLFAQEENCVGEETAHPSEAFAWMMSDTLGALYYACDACPYGHTGAPAWDSAGGGWDHSDCDAVSCPDGTETAGACNACPEGYLGDVFWSDGGWDEDTCVAVDCPHDDEIAGACAACPEGYAGSLSWTAGAWDTEACEAVACPHSDEAAGACTQCPEGETGAISWTGEDWDTDGCVASCALGEVIALNDLSDAWQTATFSQAYQSPVVIVSPPTSDESELAIVRLHRVTSESAVISLQEAACQDGDHAGETAYAWVFEAGTYTLADGAMMEVGTLDTELVEANDTWETVTLAGTYTDPVIFTTLQSSDGSAAVTVRVALSDDGDAFDLVLQEEDSVADGTHGEETVGYLVIEAGSHTLADGATLEAGTVSTGESVTTAGASFDGDAAAYGAATMSFDGSDFSAARAVALSGSELQLFVQESTCGDSEVTHNAETIAWMMTDALGTLTHNQAPDCLGTCGDAAWDACGECGGDGLQGNVCDCDGTLFDCMGECGGSAVEDCLGTCTTRTHWIGDGLCDASELGLNFNCVRFDHDGGDCVQEEVCCVGPTCDDDSTLSPEPDGLCIDCGNNDCTGDLDRLGDGVCDSGASSGLDLGIDSPVTGGSSLMGPVFECCTADGTCDDPIDFNCEAFMYDYGDCVDGDGTLDLEGDEEEESCSGLDCLTGGGDDPLGLGGDAEPDCIGVHCADGCIDCAGDSCNLTSGAIGDGRCDDGTPTFPASYWSVDSGLMSSVLRDFDFNCEEFYGDKGDCAGCDDDFCGDHGLPAAWAGDCSCDGSPLDAGACGCGCTDHWQHAEDGTPCSECIEGYAGDDCNVCADNYAMNDDGECESCEEGWTLSSGCTECEDGWGPEGLCDTKLACDEDLCGQGTLACGSNQVNGCACICDTGYRQTALDEACKARAFQSCSEDDECASNHCIETNLVDDDFGDKGQCCTYSHHDYELCYFDPWTNALGACGYAEYCTGIHTCNHLLLGDGWTDYASYPEGAYAFEEGEFSYFYFADSFGDEPATYGSNAFGSSNFPCAGYNVYLFFYEAVMDCSSCRGEKRYQDTETVDCACPTQPSDDTMSCSCAYAPYPDTSADTRTHNSCTCATWSLTDSDGEAATYCGGDREQPCDGDDECAGATTCDALTGWYAEDISEDSYGNAMCMTEVYAGCGESVRDADGVITGADDGDGQHWCYIDDPDACDAASETLGADGDLHWDYCTP